MKHLLLILLISVFSSSSLGQTGENVKLAARLSVEPYIIKATDTGFETDIVREAFALEGYSVTIVHQPPLRAKQSLATGFFDGVLTIKSHYPEFNGAALSDEYITYHNIAITLTAENIKISSIADLQDKDVYTFQLAQQALGDTFSSMAKSNKNYHEMADQKAQVAMLFAKRNDVIVLDKRIFWYFLKELKDEANLLKGPSPFDQAVTYHPIFEPSHYRIAFKDEKLRDLFNAGLRKLKESGRYQKIIDVYAKE